MRLETLHLQNFRGYIDREFVLHPQFNLVIGENGTGKTSFLEAAAVAIGSWLLGFRGHDSRNILDRDVRQVLEFVGSRYRELPQYPVRVTAAGQLHIARAGRLQPAGEIGYLDISSADKTNPCEVPVKWSRSIEGPGGRTTRGGATRLKTYAESMASAVLKQEPRVLPLIRYFGAGRLWESVRDTTGKALSKHKGKQPAELAEDADELDKALHEFDRISEPFYGYRMSVDKRCNPNDLIRWMGVERRNELDEDESSPALRLVYQAIEGMLPEISSARYSTKLSTLVLKYENGERHTFSELSDGYRNIVAVAADLAIKAAMLNPQLAERSLEMTPGVVLIDELDLHLHPKWQRRVIGDLRRTFPMLQFICTTHSPQLIGQARPDEIIQLDASRTTAHPGQSLGMDSNWILRHIMGSDDRDPDVAKALDELFEHIEQARFDEAQAALAALRLRIGEHPELVEADALIGRYTRHDGE